MKVNVFGKKTRRISQANRLAAIYRLSDRLGFMREVFRFLRYSKYARLHGSACAREVALKRQRRHAPGIEKNVRQCECLCVCVCVYKRERDQTH